MVELQGLEPWTSSMPWKRSSQLSYSPTKFKGNDSSFFPVMEVSHVVVFVHDGVAFAVADEVVIDGDGDDERYGES